MIGTRLGKWLIDRTIGKGGMGQVFLAHDDAGLQAAIKVLAAELALEPGFLQRFRRETEILGQLSHPNIVKLFESGSQDGVHYYAMEYVSGQNFEQILRSQACLPWREVLNAGLQVCPALKHAHDRGIIHRDIKPPNLLRNTEGLVKLTDFGIAKVFASRNLTNTGGVVGTAEYLSPEQAVGKPATERSDLYSLGVVFYTLLTGQTPFQGKSVAEVLHKHVYGQFPRPARLIPDLPHDIDQIVCNLLEKDPSRRPGDALVLQRRLDSIRRKLDRKTSHTLAAAPSDPTIVENRTSSAPPESEPGLGTLMSRAIRGELEAQKRVHPLWIRINRVSVLLPALLVCVGILTWGLWPKPVPSAEELFEQGSRLMATDDESNWEKARDEYFEPLERLYPDHAHQGEVAHFRQQIDDRMALKRALRAVKRGPASEAERFYKRGLRLCQEGDAASARSVWQNVVLAFSGVKGESRWVGLCEQGLAELENKSLATEHREAEMGELSRNIKSAPPSESDQKKRALESLYHNDLEALRVLGNKGLLPKK
jgi:serine/threonine-protein kinase